MVGEPTEFPRSQQAPAYAEQRWTGDPMTDENRFVEERLLTALMLPDTSGSPPLDAPTRSSIPSHKQPWTNGKTGSFRVSSATRATR